MKIIQYFFRVAGPPLRGFCPAFSLSFSPTFHCRAKNREKNWAYPRDVKTVFVKGKDKRIYCFLTLKTIRSEHFLEWKWYDPDGKLYRSTKKIKIGEKNVIYEKFIAWDGIILFREKKNGKWKIAIFLDK